MVEFTQVKKAGMQYMCGRANGNGRAALRMYHAQFHIDECRITEFFSGYIVNLVKQVRSTLPDHVHFLWGHLKNLVARIFEATASGHEIPGIFERERQSLHRRCQACITTDGRNFEQLL